MHHKVLHSHLWKTDHIPQGVQIQAAQQQDMFLHVLWCGFCHLSSTPPLFSVVSLCFCSHLPESPVLNSIPLLHSCVCGENKNGAPRQLAPCGVSLWVYRALGKNHRNGPQCCQNNEISIVALQYDDSFVSF